MPHGGGTADMGSWLQSLVFAESLALDEHADESLEVYTLVVLLLGAHAAGKLATNECVHKWRIQKL